MKRIICTLALSIIVLATNAQYKKVKMETTMGTIVLELFQETPKHTANFLKLCNEKTLDSTLFHRVIKGFMIQGGDVNSKTAGPNVQLGSGDLGYKVPAEFMPEKYFHKKYVLAAARDNNPDKASSSCQFYIVQGKVYTNDELNQMEASSGKKFTAEQRTAYTTLGGTPFLDGNYTVYGQVLEGQAVVDAIAAVTTAPGDRPVADVRIIKVREVKKRKKFLGIF
jgi:cyclophilin family peptidyl-prolyl cis-trans isomerase